MRAYLPSYEMIVPQSLSDALALLKTEPGVWQPFAGGTDLMVLFESGKLSHRKFINIWGLSELQGIQENETHIEFGALTTYAQFEKNALLCQEFPILHQSSLETGAIAIQNRGTFGGNIANASPAADSSPGLLVYDAEIELISSEGSRLVKYCDFHLGYKKTILLPHELIRSIRLKRHQNTHHYFRKVGTRKAQAISKVCFAGLALQNPGQTPECKIALGSVGPIPSRCKKTEKLLSQSFPKIAKEKRDWIHAACSELTQEISPITDLRSTQDYRLQVSLNLLTDFLDTLKPSA